MPGVLRLHLVGASFFYRNFGDFMSCACYQDIELKITEAAKNYLISHPAANYRGTRKIIKDNFSPDQKSCDMFCYSGTIWCDNCGHEKECHPTVVLPCIGCKAKIPVIAGTTPKCEDCNEL
jgi:hypothetical protein